MRPCQASGQQCISVWSPLSRVFARPEKNWAFFEHQGSLHFFYSLLPCTMVFHFDPASPRGAVLTRAWCYPGADQVQAWIWTAPEQGCCHADVRARCR